MTVKLPITARTQVKRLKERANYELAEICAVIDNSLMATVAFYDGESVHAIPMAIWREEDYLYIHGSNGSRLIQLLQTGIQACVSISRVHGLVMARSALKHSMNYDSVCIYGSFEIVPEAKKEQRMQRFVEHWMPGRWQFIRTPDKNELDAVTILRMPLTEAVLKSRKGPPKDKEGDIEQPVWAGVIPLHTQWLDAQQVAEQTDSNLPGLVVRVLT